MTGRGGDPREGGEKEEERDQVTANPKCPKEAKSYRVNRPKGKTKALFVLSLGCVANTQFVMKITCTACILNVVGQSLEVNI